MKKNDYLLIVGVLLLSAIFYIGSSMFKQPSEVVVITVDGQEFGRYDLNSNQEIEINETNILVIEDGLAYMKEAQCPDHLCIHQGEIDEGSESIICLPNKVIVTIEGSDDSSVDATAK